MWAIGLSGQTSICKAYNTILDAVPSRPGRIWSCCTMTWRSPIHTQKPSSLLLLRSPMWPWLVSWGHPGPAVHLLVGGDPSGSVTR